MKDRLGVLLELGVLHMLHRGAANATATEALQ